MGVLLTVFASAFVSVFVCCGWFCPKIPSHVLYIGSTFDCICICILCFAVGFVLRFHLMSCTSGLPRVTRREKQNLFVPIAKCICLNFWIYLSKLPNIFVEVGFVQQFHLMSCTLGLPRVTRRESPQGKTMRWNTSKLILFPPPV